MLSHASSFNIRTDRWFYFFLILHVTAWTIVPSLARFSLPLDAMEGATWGHQLQWGYDKNPFMNAWLTELAIQIGNYSDWIIYFFSQLSVALCFLSVWLLGKKIFSPLYALIAVMLLEGVQYYNLHAIDFNDNTLELGMWGLTIFFFYQSLTQQYYRYWLLTGFFAALGMMTKYYTIVLLVPMFLFLIFNADARKNFKNPALYVGFIFFLLIITPHIIWLFSHDFVTIHYALDRVDSRPSWWNHFHYPILFAWQQFESFIPPLLLCLLLFGKKENHFVVKKFDKTFLLFLGFGPLLLTILMSLLSGMKLRAGWGQPLLSFWGIVLIIYLAPLITREKFFRFIAVFYLLFFTTLGLYYFSLVQAVEPSSANFPGKEISAVITEEWEALYHQPPAFIAGPRWLAGNISYYSSHHPAIYINWNKKLSPWIDEAKLKKRGAIFVWDFTEEDKIEEPQQIMDRFKKLSGVNMMYFNWLRNDTLSPIKIGVAFLPPEI